MSGKRKPNGEIGPTGANSADSSADAPVQRELPADLQPFEAALASISPNPDRLDHDLIMFRAGQRSVARERHSASPARSLAMPAGLGAMTVVASVLFVILLTRPVVERVEVVRVPAVEPGETVSEEGPKVAQREANASNGGSALALGAASRSRQSSNLLYGAPRSRALKLELFARMLQEDAPPSAMPLPDAAEPSGEIPRPARPVPYIERLRDILDGQARAEFPSGPPITFFNPGADS